MFLYTDDLVSTIYLSHLIKKTVYHINIRVLYYKLPYTKKEWRFIDSGATVGAFYWLDKDCTKTLLSNMKYIPIEALFGLKLADDHLPFRIESDY